MFRLLAYLDGRKVLWRLGCLTSHSEGMGTVWMARGGRHGEREQRCLEHGLVGGGWEGVANLEGVGSRGEIVGLLEQGYPEMSPRARNTHAAQLWSLVRRMQEQEVVVMPLKTTGAIAVGRIAGPYRYQEELGEDLRHTRPVRWLATDVPRDQFDQDLLYSLGALMTIGRVRRDRAEERVLAAVEGKPLPVSRGVDGEAEEDVGEAPDIEALAREQVRQFISQRFAGHDLARLVRTVLRAQGFSYVEASEPGPDGGVDILAGSGPMGLDSPRLVVQVKTGQAGVDEFRALRGVVEAFRGNQGLLVTWRGFKGRVRAEARQSFFAARLWDADDLLDELFRVYEWLPDDLRSELPLKRVWALVQPE